MIRPIRAARNRQEGDNNNAAEEPVANAGQENVVVNADRAFEELIANHAEQDPVEVGAAPVIQQVRQPRQARNNPRQRRNQPRQLAESSSSSESDGAEEVAPAPLQPEVAENPLRRAVRAKKEWARLM